ncbi:MAG: ketoacyl-ACP synthase III [Betaproteobacteria bacterium]|nr:ketoacyl-ACP synthase III [Betaproteobacteria bacterium]
MTFSRIAATGSYLPERVVTNHDLAERVDTSDEWIVTRSGISQRHFAADGERSSDLATAAARRALDSAGWDADSLDLIVVATTTPDMAFPSTACMVQAKLGVTNRCAAFDVQAVCSGFVYALASADAMIRTGVAKRALVIGAETLSRMLDWTDRGTCVLFGDGAGCVLLEAATEPGILGCHLHADGRHLDMLKAPGVLVGGKIDGNPFIEMDGGAVFKFAVEVLAETALETLQAHDMTGADLDWLVPHQANIRIIQATAKRLHLPMERVVTTVAQHGNTSAASIPLAFDVAVRDGRIQRGQTVLMEGIGAGFAWGSALVRY